jgi:cyclomaltodextrinase / maltogenic alpha-amylase / neopullulanase
MTKHILLLLILAAVAISCNQQQSEGETTADTSQPPAWAADAIWYQIFVERFNNGDPANDPTRETIFAASGFHPIPENWQVTTWTQNWYKQDEWAKSGNMKFYDGLQLRRYGGDLQGILDKLDYLEDLGVTALYFNPINDAPSLHKFDARNWRHIDVNFGPDPEGDMEIIASEVPDDPSTWQWTAADKMFLQLVEELHKRNMRIILDFSWNHTGVEFWAWKDIVKNQENSKYKNWYEIESFDDRATPEDEFAYKGWANLSSLPEVKKVDITTPRVHGKPYEGNIHPEVKAHIFNVTKRWLAPNGDNSKGIDGYRMDVADQIGMGFWREWRTYVKSIKPDAYIVGEIWWEEWPDKLMDPVPYVQGDVFDAVMFYQIYRPARYFFAKTDYEIDAPALVEALNFEWNRLSKPVRYAMMNTAATHDSPRLLSSFYNTNKYKYKAKPNDDPAYKTGKPDEETYQRMKLYLLHQFTNVGAPQIWNGDEIGMWGADDPDCRKPLWWPEYTFEPEYRNNILPGDKTFDEVGFNHELFDFYKDIVKMRKENTVLSHGEIEFIVAEGKKLAYRRFDENNEIIVLFNLEQSPEEFAVSGKNAVDLMTGDGVPAGNITLNPLTAKVIKTVK